MKALRVLLLFVLSLPALSAFGADLSIQYEQIARTNVTSIPDGVGTFTVFGKYQAIDDAGNIVFLGGGGVDGGGKTQAGVYTLIDGQYQKVADMNTPVPGGNGETFTTFYADDRNDIDAARVAFTANTSSSSTVLGLYSNVGQASSNDLVEIVVADGGAWESISDPWVDGNIVTMRGQQLVPEDQTAILSWDGTNQSLGFIDPGAGYLFIPGTQSSTSDDATIFSRGTYAGAWELVISDGNTHEILVDTGSTPIPGQPGAVFSTLYDFPVVDRGGLDAAFKAYGNQRAGIYKRVNGGALQTVTRTGTLIPGSNDLGFLNFPDSAMALADGQVAFYAIGPNFLEGIYTDVGGELAVIVDNQANSTIELNGQTEQVGYFDFSHKSFALTPNGYSVVFLAELQSGGSAIIKATISDGTNPQPNISVSGDGNFGDVNTGSDSTQTVTISNTGNANLVLGNLNGLAAPFAIVSNNCNGATLAPSNSCSVNVRFSPTVTGLRTDTLFIPSNDPDQANIGFGVSGTGTASATPDISVSGNGAFGNVDIGSNLTRTVTVSNSGTANLVMGNLNGLAAPFAIVSNNCNGATLAPSNSCSVDVRFSPTVTGLRTDTLFIPSNDPDQANIGFGVSGTGTASATPDISVSGNGAFGNVDIGSNLTRTVTVSNSGTANLVMGNLNGLAAPFAIVSNNCNGATLAPSNSCSVNVRFSPTATGLRTDTLFIPSNDPDEANIGFGVSGTGTASATPDISVSGNGAFGNVDIGSNLTRTVTVSNSGTANLVMGNLNGLAAPFAIVSNNCNGATLAPSNSCSVNVRFSPTVTGLRTDTLNIPSNDPDEANIGFGVSGTGTDPDEPDISVSGNGAFGDVETGSSSTRSITVSNTGTANLVMGSLGGLAAPFAIVSNNCNGATLAPSNSCLVSVRFSPTVTGLKTDTLNIPSNDPDEANVNFGVSGTGTAPPGLEVEIVNDGFEDGDANGWSLNGDIAVSNIVKIGQYALRHVKGGTSVLSVSTVDYTDVSITMHLAATDLANGESCFAEVSTNGGSSWISVVQVNNGSDNGTFYSGTVSPAGADDNSNLQLRFRSNGGKKPDYCYGDNVIVTGTSSGGSLEPDIAVSGNGSFGDVAIGGNSTRSVTISNVGTANLVIGNLFGLAAPFSTIADSCSGATLVPAGSCTLSVRFSPTSTGFRSDTLVIPSNDPDQANINFGVSGTGTTVATPDINVSGNGAFGNINVGSSSTRSVTISNTGSANLVISGMGGLAAPFNIVANTCGTVVPSGSCTVSIRFAPVSAGTFADTLVISSNDPDESSVNFGVNGTGTTVDEPDIAVSGNGAFGDIEKDTSSTRTVTISNTGTGNLVISGVGGLTAPFAVVANTCSTVVPAGFCTINVRFAPTSTGTFADTLVISSNDPDEASVNFGLSGTGTEPPGQEETILEEGFEDGDANGWSLDGNVSVDGILALDNYSLRHVKSSTSTLNVSTAGYTDVSITMHIAATSLDNGEGCYAEISTNGGATWIPVVQVLNGNDDGSWNSGTISPASADDIPDLQLRFRSTGGKKPDYCYGDDVIVSGTLN